MNGLSEWQNFYVILGSAAGALIGLQFVVMALIADMPMQGEESQAVTAFSTPSIVHFGVVLLVGAAMEMPWHGLHPLTVVWGVVGLGGLGYTAFTGWRLRTQTSYKPVAEDWIFRVVLPAAIYIALAAAWWVSWLDEGAALFQVAFVVLALLFIGIHHAWDNATYLVFVKRREMK
ncbi:MAG TPA: hypothetical protein VMD97_11940 [Candidatus Aquilonibacter sp.]|nr:hypothetical protein [Candidatus Aquilonibacter sp.]